MNVLKYGKLEANPAKLMETVNIQMSKVETPSTALKEYAEQSEFLMPRIEAIHAGRTRNYNHYPADKLRGDASIHSGVYSWLQPYAKPVIYNHDTNTEATGRVYSAAYAEYTRAGRPGLIVIPKITESNAIQALKDGRLLTVSIGASSDAAICSICGTDIVNEGYCGHMKGEEYEGRVAEWITGNLWFDELSWVNVPADAEAMVVDTQSSIYMDVPRESDEEKPLTQESAPSALHEYYGVPKSTRLIVVESKVTKTIEAEINKQEENEEMDNELQPETTVETPVVEPEVTVEEPAIEPAVTVEPPADDSDPSSETETPVETEVPAEEPEIEPVAEEGAELAALKTENVQLKSTSLGLQSQVEGLTKELKTLYVERIAEKSAIAEDKKQAFVEKLSGRTIESLRDRLEDLEEGMLNITPKEVEASAGRQVTKVKSPLATNESVEKKELSQTEKVSMLSKLVSQKK